MRDQAGADLDTHQRAIADGRVEKANKGLMQLWSDAGAYWKSLWKECA
jgi:hypothetical protein